MSKVKITIIFLILITFNLCAQDTDLKDIYTDVTTAINSALLTRTGAMEISGSMSYNYLKTKYTFGEEWSLQTIQIEPAFSYFFADNFSAGIDLSYLFQKTDSDASEESVSFEQTSIGPVFKMYFGEEKFRPFIMTNYLFLVGDNSKGSELDLGAGIFYHVTGNFGLSLFGKYGIIWSSKDIIDSQNRFFIGVGLSNFIL